MTLETGPISQSQTSALALACSGSLFNISPPESTFVELLEMTQLYLPGKRLQRFGALSKFWPQCWKTEWSKFSSAEPNISASLFSETSTRHETTTRSETSTRNETTASGKLGCCFITATPLTPRTHSTLSAESYEPFALELLVAR